MSSFKFEINWTLNGVDMTSNLYTFYMGPYEGFGLEAPPVQIPHMGPYKMRIVCGVISNPFNVQFASNLKDDISV